MKPEIYDIVLYSPIGPKKGWLQLHEEVGNCSADIYLMRHLNHFLAVVEPPDEYCLSGKFWTLVGDVACRIKMKIRGNTLSAIAETAKGRMRIEGTVAEKEEEILADSGLKEKRDKNG